MSNAYEVPTVQSLLVRLEERDARIESLVDDKLHRKAHSPTVGILICGSKNDHTVRYVLGRSTSPMAVALDVLPDDTE